MSLIHTVKQNFFKISKLGLCLTLFSLSSLSFNTDLHALNVEAKAHGHHSEDAVRLGTRLETEFWTLVQDQNIKEFSKKFTKIYQGFNISGAFSRSQQIKGLTGATLSGFTINNPVATRFQDVLVFSYDFVAFDSNLVSGPSVTIWKKYNKTWKIVSHSYVPF